MKTKSVWITGLSLLGMLVISGPAFAVDHGEFIKGPFKTGEEVTTACLQCHDKEAADLMKTSHWKWKGVPRNVKGLENSKEEYGKANLLNNFCTDVEGGSRPFCTKCHAGYGWTDSSAPLEDKTKVDCLVCHAKEGN